MILAFGGLRTGTTHHIDVQVLRLREKLEVDPSPPRVIRTERGAGYAFALPVEPF
jgi:DNA-binding response OmpR family regulator